MWAVLCLGVQMVRFSPKSVSFIAISHGPQYKNHKTQGEFSVLM